MSLGSMIRVTATMICMGLAAFSVQAADFKEGQDYTVVGGIPEVTKPVVREFFSYNCPHCYHQDPLIQKTAELLKGKVALERTPVGASRPQWVLSQEAYYLAQKFKVLNQVHAQIFTLIHEQQQPFSREEDLQRFFEQQGVDKADVAKAVGSADAKLALANYDAQTQLAQIRAVPSLLVNGKYLITAHLSDAEQLAELIEYLAKKPD